MTFQLPPLPYALDALEPYISRETLEYHYGKHHQAYVTKLNDLVAGSAFEKQSLEQIIQQATGPIFNNAAQDWNHTFYWHCMSPKTGQAPKGALNEAITQAFGSLAGFQEQFTKSAISLFGSGWTWLVKNQSGHLEIVNTGNAGTPMTDKKTALLTCDVWEHAYYIDYRNLRAKYVETFWKILNWEFVEKNFAGK